MNFSDILNNNYGKTKKEKRAYIQLKVINFGNESQGSIISFLNKSKIDGDVKYFSSIYTINSIIIIAKKNVYEKLIKRNDIDRIFIEKIYHTSCNNTWSINKIKANLVWNDLNVKGDGIVVAMIDGGVDYNHSDLHNNIYNNLGEDFDNDGHTLEWNGSKWVLDAGDINNVDDDGNGLIDDLIGYDFCTYDDGITDYDPIDEGGHGTHVAGIVAGNGTAGTQTGVAPNVKIRCFKINADGFNNVSDSALVYDIISAIEFVYLHTNCDVISLSQGIDVNGSSEYTSLRADFRTVCDAATSAGVIICVAAGNNYGSTRVPYDINSPGDVPSVITVGATRQNDDVQTQEYGSHRSWRSAVGPATWATVPSYYDYPYTQGSQSDTGLFKPDISAPGVSVTSTKLNGGYEERSGTSMATPAVSGIAALLLSVNSSLTPSEIKSILRNTADKVGQFSYTNGRNNYIGYGRVNANSALIYTIENYGGIVGGNGKTITFHDDITIKNGVTLTISSGTTVKFDPGKKFTIKGKLIADNVTFQSTSSSAEWIGMEFNGSGTNASEFSNCTIRDTEIGIRLVNTNVTIETAEVFDTEDYGISINGGEPIIYDCYIHDTGDYGISANNAGQNSFIRKTSLIECDGGILIFGTSNKINLRGKSGQSYGLNKIYDYYNGGSSTYGILITGGSPDLGQYSPSSQRGKNDFIHNARYVIKNTTSSEIPAEKNYWGGTPYSSWFYGSVGYQPYYSSSQGGGSSLEKLSDIEDDKQILIEANELADIKNAEAAASKYKELIEKYPDSRYADISLAWAMSSYISIGNLETQRLYLQKMTKHNNPKVSGKAWIWLQKLEALCGNKDTAEKIVHSISIDDLIGVEISLNWANDLYNIYSDAETAQKIFDELKTAKPDDDAIESTINAIIKTASINTDRILVMPKISADEPEAVEEYGFSIYPNPFNPSTTIQYNLPRQSSVTVVIYNIRGQKVKEYSYSSQNAGVHQLVWNGLNQYGAKAASGLYIIRFSAKSLEGQNELFNKCLKVIMIK